eukprot:TRINITY_DN3635_c0_g2_i3.p1 TRINITY_DN3635_c0_g2~~TRINITY_DN3635_c0_g2_i3.p1  ORF type:complete len:277 (-),score=64.64 TRINITY_DN3635_c0_g2_i3:162-893(-)
MFGRVELLSWYNSFLSLNLSKIEETASGAAHCQIFDALYPGKIPLNKVNFNATRDYEYTHNYKILQEVFMKLGLDKKIPVSTLIQGKYQANLEFCQWVKGYFDRHYTGGDYDAIARRKESKIVIEVGKGPLQKPSKTQSRVKIANKENMGKVQQLQQMEFAPTPNSTTLYQQNLKLKAQVESFKSRVVDLQLNLDQAEREREFYFTKLREIEIMTDRLIDSGMMESVSVRSVLEDIQAIMYAD